MLAKNDIDRIAGVLLVLLVVHWVVSIVTQVDVSFDRPDVREDLQGLIDDQALYATKTAFRLAGSLLLVFTGGALYSVFRSHDPAQALFVLLGLLAAGGAFALSDLNSFGLMFLARDFIDASGAEADALANVARAVKFIESAAFLTGITMLGVGVLSIGALILRSKTMSAWFGWWAVLSGLLSMAAWIAANMSDALFIIPAIGALMALLLFLILGIGLLTRGSPEPASA